MKTKIIIITGKAQSGKDTSAEHIKKNLKDLMFTSNNYHFAEELKYICRNLFGLTKKQCWGSNHEKDTPTKLKWKDLPLGENKLSELMINKYPKDIHDYMTAREVMQIVGTDIFRKMDEDCWVRSTVNKITTEKLNFAIISDARFPNEIEFFKGLNPIIIRLTREVLNNKHLSEVALDKYDFSLFKHYHVINNHDMNIYDQNKELDFVLANYI